MQRYIVALFTVVLLGVGGALLFKHRNKIYAHDQLRPQRAYCVNNLKQIAVAFKIWAGDHGGQFPFNVSTNAEGTSEFRSADKNGFDSNIAAHLQAMSNEFFTTRILICPKDTSKKPALDFGSLRADNVTYRLRTSITNMDSKQILMVCPIDGNILYSDGTVKADETGMEESPNHRIMTVPDSTHGR